MDTKENNFWLNHISKDAITTFTCELLGDYLSHTQLTDESNGKNYIDIVYENSYGDPVHKQFDAIGFNSPSSCGQYARYVAYEWRKFMQEANINYSYYGKSYGMTDEQFNQDSEMNNFWLSNISEDSLKAFGDKYWYMYCWSSLDSERNSNRKHMLIMCEDRWGYPDDNYFDAYGYHNYHKKQINETIKDWYKLVRDANAGKTFNGITYTEAFKKYYNLDAKKSNIYNIN